MHLMFLSVSWLFLVLNMTRHIRYISLGHPEVNKNGLTSDRSRLTVSVKTSVTNYIFFDSTSQKSAISSNFFGK